MSATDLPFELTVASGRGARFVGAGSIRDVLAGRISSALEISAAPYLAGFEAGSPHGIDSIGEFMLVQGTAFAKSTDPSSRDFERLIHGSTFVSNGVLLLPRGTEPTWHARSREDQVTDLSLGLFYRHLLEATGDVPCCFLGPATFKMYEANFASRSPTDGVPILENLEKYYLHPPILERDVHTIVMGCIANQQQVASGGSADELQKLLYINPFDDLAGLAFHAHALVLHRPIQNLSEFTPDQARDVHHLLSRSLLHNFAFEVYRMDSIEAIN